MTSSNLKRASNEDARQYAYRILKLRILEFLMLPRDKLSEEVLASSLSVSRTPVHDTLARLSRENLVTLIPLRGAFVSALNSEQILESIWVMKKCSVAAIDNLYHVQLNDSDIELLNTILYEIRNNIKINNFSKIPVLLRQYYQLLFNLADMDMIFDSIQKISGDVLRLLTLIDSSADTWDILSQEIEDLTKALISREHDIACTLINKHLSHVETILPEMQSKYPDYFIT